MSLYANDIACYKFVTFLSFLESNLHFLKNTQIAVTQEKDKFAFYMVRMQLHNNTFTVCETYAIYEYSGVSCS